MSLVFTEYVKQLSSSDESPSQGSFAEVWNQLRHLLQRELRKRGLWEAPPSYLGVYGRTKWWEEESSPDTASWQEDGLEELTAELYTYVFIDRLGKLIDYVKRKNTIEALVSVNAGHLLYELQKKHDPLGYRIFEIFHQAVAEAVEAKEFFVLRGNPRIRNDTVLGSRLDFDPGQVPPAPEEKVGEWNDVLMPDLVKGKGRAREWVVATLRIFLRRLPEEGTEAFLFHQILNPLKRDARLRWALRLETSQGEMGLVEDTGEDATPQLVPLVSPDPGVENQESLEKLDRCLMAAFEGQELDPTQDELKSLWQNLHRRAQAGEVPSRRKLADELALNRRRLSKLLSTLGDMVDDCRRVLAGVALKESIMEGAQGDGGRSMRSRAETLRAATAEARRRHAETAAELLQRQDTGPQPGDVFRISGADEWGVEWFLLREEEGFFEAIPADSSPLAGSLDLVVRKEEVGGPLTLRCGHIVRVSATDLDLSLRTGVLSVEILKQAREQGALSPRVERDPELMAWIRDVIEPAREYVRLRLTQPEVAKPSEVGSETPVRSSRRWWGHNNPYAIAASIFLALSLGLLSGVVWQHQEIRRLTAGSIQTAGNIPYKSLAFSPDGQRSGPEKLVLPADARELLLILNVYEFDDGSFEEYRLLVLERETTDEIYRSERLFEMGPSNLTVKLSTVEVPEGEYRLELRGIDSLREKTLATLDLDLEYDDAK